MRYNASLIEKTPYTSITSNTGSVQNITIVPEEAPLPETLQMMRNFFSSLFGETMSLTSANQISELLKQRLSTIISELNGYAALRTQYPFVAGLGTVIAHYEELRDRSTAWYFNEFSSDLRQTFIELHESTVLPIRDFMKGAQRSRYDELAALARDDNSNAAEADGALLAHIRSELSNPTIYTRLQTLNDPKTRLEGAIAELLGSTRTQAIAQIISRYDTLILKDLRWPLHTTERQSSINAKRDKACTDITATTSIARIRQLAADFIGPQVTQILNVDLVLPDQKIIDPPPPQYVDYKNVSFDAGLSKITNDADLEQFLDAQREALSKVLGDGKQIVLEQQHAATLRD